MTKDQQIAALRRVCESLVDGSVHISILREDAKEALVATSSPPSDAGPAPLSNPSAPNLDSGGDAQEELDNTGPQPLGFLKRDMRRGDLVTENDVQTHGEMMEEDAK